MKTCKNCHYQVYKTGVCQELPCLIRVSSASTWVSTTVLVSSIVYHNWATRESNICKKKLPKINDIMFFFFSLIASFGFFRWYFFCFFLFTHWHRNCALVLLPECCCWFDGVAQLVSVSRERREEAGTQLMVPEVAVAGSPGQRANSPAGTRRAGITEASANNYP